MRYFLLLVLTASSLLCSCQSKKKRGKDFSSLFDYGKSVGVLDNNKINEASGIDASIANPNKFWTHNDSGGKSELFLINEKGEYVASAILKGLKNRDWEDITVGPGPDSTKSYVYVGEIGDNNAVHEYKYIYRFEEPILEKGKNIIIQSFDTITFQFDNGRRDSEALFIDQQTKNLYIFSKREEQINLYQLPFPQRTHTNSIATTVLSLPISQVVAVDYSNASGELILKNYDSIYYWKKEAKESLQELLAKKATLLAYKREPQGEAICFSSEGDGYFTLSEEAKDTRPELIFYKRKQK